MQEANPRLTEAQARHLTVHGANQNEDGTYSWKFDNYSRADRPVGIYPEESFRLWSRITCPTLLVRGLESWVGDPEADGRAAHFHNARFVDVSGAGHWVHHDRLEHFLGLVRGFLAEAA